MPKVQGMGSCDGTLPVFVSPHSVTFYTDDPKTHKQVITLYNVYDVTVHFKVLCTAPRKYSVMDVSGTVKPKCGVDIVIRHKDVRQSHEGVRDKLRIHLYEVGLKTVAGSKEIPLLLLPTKERSDETFENLPSSAASMQRGAANINSEPGAGGRQFPQARPPPAGTGVAVILAVIVCLVALMLPCSEEESASSSLPLWLYIPNRQKLLAAYVLGMITLYLARS